MIAGVAPDWIRVECIALAMAAKTRDLRVAIALLRVRTRLPGLAGYTEGLELPIGLVQHQWDGVHPHEDALDDAPEAHLAAQRAARRG